ncbi:MAG TPA: polyphosphate polymerase domain-containing protein [Glycomyces sp.]|nr:polyphosphate polymerase domain-containing protein [Glycomyces sp.]
MFAHLPAIGLGELVETAELQTRVDRKYLVDRAALAALLADLAGELAVLEIEGERRFSYESVYFDTPALASYFGAARSRRRRFKVRTRTYLDSGRCMLEVKTRAGEATVKRRWAYRAEDRHRLTAGGRWLVETSGAVPVRTEDLAPAMVTRYLRATVLHRPTGTRLTCDTGLRFEDFGGLAGAMSAETAVVETKSPGGAGPVDRWLWGAGHRPCRISKYGTGMAFLHPDLPANKWNLTLRRHFDWRPRERSRAVRPVLVTRP